ncbi:leucyl aminopeptidase [Anaerospora sp.]|uniref:leucyl aminopeptidase n=1 Tax=Anaerospora sp. TaxID=1960278 RepID=UPI00289A953F|nr:leucyl aminopeptidase [Anaerospora sp.]
MNIAMIPESLVHVPCDTLVIGHFENESISDTAVAELDQALAGQITTLLSTQPSCVEYGKTTVIYTLNQIVPKSVLLLGLGKKQKITNDRIRALSAIALKAARQIRSTTLATTIYAHDNGQDCVAAAQAIVEGIILGNYQFNQYKSNTANSDTIEKVLIVQHDTSLTLELGNAEIEKSIIIGKSVNFARDLVNHPANYMTPSRMAEEASFLAEQYGMDLSVLEFPDIESLQMNAMLAVAQGSEQPPKLIVLKHMGDVTNNEVIAFVGKGITFDSGGISLKPGEGMQDMKDDMGGGAAVLGAMAAIAQLKLAVNIIAIIPCTENMPSGKALKPGDVITSMDKKTIEIINTDAEGRLVLADGVSYARYLGATKIIDLATLTGACVVALGTITSGVLTNNDAWCQQVLDAAEQSGEKMWKLPNHDDYFEQIKSTIADLKNSGGRHAGAITAGLFIAQFAAETPWVHIDIAGTVTTPKDTGYNQAGATGVGVRTLIRLAETLQKR